MIKLARSSNGKMHRTFNAGVVSSSLTGPTMSDGVIG